MFAATTRHNVREGVLCHRESGGFYMSVYYTHVITTQCDKSYTGHMIKHHRHT